MAQKQLRSQSKTVRKGYVGAALFQSTRLRRSYQAVLAVMMVTLLGCSTYVLGLSSAAVNYNLAWCSANGVTVSISKNSRSSCVREVQGFLKYRTHDYYNQTGYQDKWLCDPKGIDGSFGSNTQKAVRCYQDKYSNSLSIDGVVGQNTYRAMLADCTKFKGRVQVTDVYKTLDYCYN